MLAPAGNTLPGETTEQAEMLLPGISAEPEADPPLVNVAVATKVPPVVHPTLVSRVVDFFAAGNMKSPQLTGMSLKVHSMPAISVALRSTVVVIVRVPPS